MESSTPQLREERPPRMAGKVQQKNHDGGRMARRRQRGGKTKR